MVPGGKPVKVSGTNLEGATEVSFGGASATFEVVSSEAIQVVTPPGQAPMVYVRVSTPEGISAITAADQFEYQSKPIQIKGVSPVGATKEPPAMSRTTTSIWIRRSRA
jgi:large repetitive protein